MLFVVKQAIQLTFGVLGKKMVVERGVLFGEKTRTKKLKMSKNQSSNRRWALMEVALAHLHFFFVCLLQVQNGAPHFSIGLELFDQLIVTSC